MTIQQFARPAGVAHVLVQVFPLRIEEVVLLEAPDLERGVEELGERLAGDDAPLEQTQFDDDEDREAEQQGHDGVVAVGDLASQAGHQAGPLRISPRASGTVAAV